MVGAAPSACWVPSLSLQGLQAFLPFEITYLRTVVRRKYPEFWYWQYSPGARDGEVRQCYVAGAANQLIILMQECCSRHWITSHYVDAHQMYVLHARVLDGREGNGTHPSEHHR